MKGQGKGIGKIIDQNAKNSHVLQVIETPYTQKLQQKSEQAEAHGSIKRNVHVLVKTGATSLIAKIVDSRLTDSKTFEYYVTFLDLNRRMDRWIPQDDIIRTLKNEKEIKNEQLLAEINC